MLYFIACHAPDLHGIKVADGLARVRVSSLYPHIAFKTIELAQYYLDLRHANKLCYPIREDEVTDILWHNFKDGVLVFKNIRDVRRSLEDNTHVFNIDRLQYTPEAINAVVN